MADYYRIDAIRRSIKEVVDRIYLMRKCSEVTDMLLSIRENEPVVEMHTEKFIAGFDSHITAIVHDLDSIAYTADYQIGVSLDEVERTLQNIEKDE